MSVSRTVVLTTVESEHKTDVKRYLSNDQWPCILYARQNQGRVLDSGQEWSKSVLWNSMALRGTREERGRGKEEEDVSNLVFYVRWTSTVIYGRRRRRKTTTTKQQQRQQQWWGRHQSRIIYSPLLNEAPAAFRTSPMFFKVWKPTDECSRNHKSVFKTQLFGVTWWYMLLSW